MTAAPTTELSAKSQAIIAATVAAIIDRGPGGAAKLLAYYDRADVAPRLDAYAVCKREQLRAQLRDAHKCCDCGRPLDDPDSVARGIGPDCLEKRIAEGRPIPELVAVRTCRQCGCTDEQACWPVGCVWTELDLCSACVDG